MPQSARLDNDNHTHDCLGGTSPGGGRLLRRGKRCTELGVDASPRRVNHILSIFSRLIWRALPHAPTILAATRRVCYRPNICFPRSSVQIYSISRRTTTTHYDGPVDRNGRCCVQYFRLLRSWTPRTVGKAARHSGLRCLHRLWRMTCCVSDLH